MATAQQTLQVAASQIGYKESPASSNHTKYGAWFGVNGEPWCVIGIDWVCDQVGVALPTRTASVYALMAAFKSVGRFHTSDPQPGDIVFWNYGGGHAEFVEQVPLTGRSLVDIGFNTSSSDGSPDNGGEVARKTRPWNSQCLGFGRPVYSSNPVENNDMPPTFNVTNPAGPGYWTVRRADGGVYAYDSAPFFGSMAGQPMNAHVAALGVHRNTAGAADGYWLLGTDGGVFAFGAARFTDSYAAHPEWHTGNRYMVDIIQNGDGYSIITIEANTNPPKPDEYDLSVARPKGLRGLALATHHKPKLAAP